MSPTQSESTNTFFITVYDLSNQVDISVRTFNICEKYGLSELRRLLNFYSQNGDFYKLSGVGRKTNEELEKICHFYSQHEKFINDIKDADLKSLSEKEQQVTAIDPVNLSALKINFLNLHVRSLFEELSARSKNALQNFLNEDINYITLHRFFFKEQIIVQKLSNVGKKSAEEIIYFLDTLNALAFETLSYPDDVLKEELFVKEFPETLSISSDFMHEFIPQIKLRNFPLFAFLQKLILGRHIFNETKTAILLCRMGWFEEISDLGFEEVGEQIGLSRERVRQIAHTLGESINEKFTFLYTFNRQLLEVAGNYGIDINKDLVFVRQTTADDINYREGTRFTCKFFTKIFSFIYADTHTLLGDKFDFFQNHYLVRREIATAFDFEAFVKDLRQQTQQRIKDDYEIDLDGYLYTFLKVHNVAILRQVRRVCEDLALLEFGEVVRLELPSSLVLCRNAKMQMWEYAYDALERIGSPSKISFILEKIISQYPDFEGTIESLRGVMVKEKNSHFISFSRTSTFGLAKWENEREDIRGGTIRDIVEDYLQQYSEPKHYYDIADFVLLYRPSTSPKGVHGNLQLDESGRFQEFSGGFWGLAERDYSNFKVRQLPKHTRSLATSFITEDPNPNLPNLIAYLCQVCGAQPAQIRAWVDEKIRIGILRSENDKLVVLK